MHCQLFISTPDWHSRVHSRLDQPLLVSLIHDTRSETGASLSTRAVFTRVVYHSVTSSFFGIGILQVSDLFGGRYFRSVLLIWRELLFSAKGVLAGSKRGLVPPFSSKRGPLPPFWGKKGFPPKKSYRNVHTERQRFPSVSMVNTEKYRPIPTRKYRFDNSSYSTLARVPNSTFLSSK